MRAAWWWIDRWRNSTAYIDMTAEEQGLYRNLLDEVWHRPGGIIPDEALSRASGDAEAWRRSGAKVLRWMQRVNGGWTNNTALEVRRQSERRAENQHNYRERFKLRPNRQPKADNGADNGADNAGDSLSLSPSLDLTNLLDREPSPSQPSPTVLSKNQIEGASPPLDQAFDRFWAIYPRKIGKAAALKVWKRLHPSERLTTLMCEAVARQKTWPQWTKDGGQFIPHPATWLNQGRWDDEPTAPAPTLVSDRTRANQAAGAAFVARMRGQS